MTKKCFLKATLISLIAFFCFSFPALANDSEVVSVPFSYDIMPRTTLMVHNGEYMGSFNCTQNGFEIDVEYNLAYKGLKHETDFTVTNLDTGRSGHGYHNGGFSSTDNYRIAYAYFDLPAWCYPGDEIQLDVDVLIYYYDSNNNLQHFDYSHRLLFTM